MLRESALTAQGRQHRLDLLPLRLEPRGQDQPLAEMRRILVHREPGPLGGDLEEHPTRLFEVDRAEPESVDDRRGLGASRQHPLPDAELLGFVGHPEGYVVDGASAPGTPVLGRQLAHFDPLAGASPFRAEPVPAGLLSHELEAESVAEEAGGCRQVALPEANRVEASYLLRFRNGALLPGCELPG